MSIGTFANRLTDTNSKWYLLLGVLSLVKAFGLRHNRRRSRSELFDAAMFLSLGLLLRYFERDDPSGKGSMLTELLGDSKGSKLSELLQESGRSKESILSELLEESGGSKGSKLSELLQESGGSKFAGLTKGSEESSPMDSLKRRLSGS